MIKWEDVTTYSRGDKERVPRVWQCKIADAIVIKVHRFHALQGWFLTCSSFDISAWNLTDSEDVEDAKKAALEYVRGYLEREIRDYQRCIEELDAEIRDVCYYQVIAMNRKTHEMEATSERLRLSEVTPVYQEYMEKHSERCLVYVLQLP